MPPKNDPNFTRSYALEKFGQAVHELVMHPGRVQERLEAAFMRFHPVWADDLPEGELRRRFAGIRDNLTFDEATGNEGRLAATLRNLSDEDASAIAARIWRLYYELQEWLDNSTG